MYITANFGIEKKVNRKCFQLKENKCKNSNSYLI